VAEDRFIREFGSQTALKLSKKNLTKAVKILFDRVVIKMDQEADRTKGGIIIPEKYRERTQLGKVIAMGDGKEHDSTKTKPMSVKVGDVVIFSKHDGMDFALDGENHTVINERNILAVVT
jgi:chaperonin GroES